MLVGTIMDTFEIKGRGLVVVVKSQGDRFASDVKLRVGDEIEIVHDAAAKVRAIVAGLEMSTPPPPPNLRGFLLRGVSKTDVPIGAEVLTVE
jgi:translation elongation factor EF-Tu-like GTPase